MMLIDNRNLIKSNEEREKLAEIIDKNSFMTMTGETTILQCEIGVVSFVKINDNTYAILDIYRDIKPDNNKPIRTVGYLAAKEKPKEKKKEEMYIVPEIQSYNIVRTRSGALFEVIDYLGTRYLKRIFDIDSGIINFDKVYSKDLKYIKSSLSDIVEVYRIVDLQKYIAYINKRMKQISVIDITKENNCLVSNKEILKCIYKRKEIDWSKVEIDTPVYLIDKKRRIPYHFAEFKNNEVYVWECGKTSHTIENIEKKVKIDKNILILK